MSLLHRLFGNSKTTENQAVKPKEESLQVKQTGAQPRPSPSWFGPDRNRGCHPNPLKLGL